MGGRKGEFTWGHYNKFAIYPLTYLATVNKSVGIAQVIRGYSPVQLKKNSTKIKIKINCYIGKRNTLNVAINLPLSVNNPDASFHLHASHGANQPQLLRL
jgi:hypothetical protein